MMRKSTRILLLASALSLPTALLAAGSQAAPQPTQGVSQMTLSVKQDSLAQIGAYTARGDMAGLKTALNQALNQGMTVNEIRDAMVQLYAYTGFPRSLNALTALSETLKARQAQGLKSEEGRTPRRPEHYDALQNGSQTQTQLTGREVDVSALSPDIDRYLKTHLFGDIFASDLLSWQEREIVTVAALAQLPGAESQLNSHLNIGKRNGLSDAQLAAAQNILAPKAMSVFPAGEENTAYAQYFQGRSYLNMLSTGQVSVGNVTFEPGTRNNWHIHHASKGGGQILLVTAGRGYYQEWDKPARELKAGDVVNIPAGVKHWHGASPNEWFQHLAIEVPGENSRNEWLEPVSDADYGKLK